MVCFGVRDLAAVFRKQKNTLEHLLRLPQTPGSNFRSVCSLEKSVGFFRNIIVDVAAAIIDILRFSSCNLSSFLSDEFSERDHGGLAERK